MILRLARVVVVYFSQSLLGEMLLPVRISTTSPECSGVRNGTIFSLTMALLQRSPTSEWMA